MYAVSTTVAAATMVTTVLLNEVPRGGLQVLYAKVVAARLEMNIVVAVSDAVLVGIGPRKNVNTRMQLEDNPLFEFYDTLVLIKQDELLHD